jgi:hypothetical protein
MMNVGINVFNFLSIEGFLKQSIAQTQAVNFCHDDVIQCYLELANEMGWVDVYNNLINRSNSLPENQDIIRAASKHLHALRHCKLHDKLAN